MINLVWPIPDVATCEVTSPFGPRKHPVTGRPSDHTGVDIRAAQGTICVAPLNGAVKSILIDYAHGGGTTLVFRGHANGHIVQIGLCHLSAGLRQQGDHVTAGDFLCLSGGTPGTPGAGRSTGPHLHMTIRIDGERVDPMDTDIFSWRFVASQPTWKK